MQRFVWNCLHSRGRITSEQVINTPNRIESLFRKTKSWFLNTRTEQVYMPLLRKEATYIGARIIFHAPVGRNDLSINAHTIVRTQ